MPRPVTNRQEADRVRNVVGHVEDLWNAEMVDRVIEDGSIPLLKLEEQPSTTLTPIEINDTQSPYTASVGEGINAFCI